MNRWVGKLAVVTGASSGIGAAIAKTLKMHGMIVFGFARSKEKMEKLISAEGSGKFYACECDVASGEQILETFRWIRENFGVVQVLVNNAGVAISGSICDNYGYPRQEFYFTETSRTDWDNVFNINVIAVLECSKVVANLVRESDVEGHIININSLQGHRVYNFGSLQCNVYGASKYAMTALTESLRNELSSRKIRLTSISPGAVDTQLLEKGGFHISKPRDPSLKAEAVAQATVFALGVPENVEITELTICATGERR